jgi:hypothetical protein
MRILQASAADFWGIHAKSRLVGSLPIRYSFGVGGWFKGESNVPKQLDLSERIHGLLERRQQHAAAIVTIDETLSRVAGALSVNGRAHKLAAVKGIRAGKRRRTRRKFAVSGEQSILAFVKGRSNPIGRDIEKHWASEGRAVTAANLLSKLVKEKKLKRTPLKNERGSRYSLA